MSLKSDTILSLLTAGKHLGLSYCTHLSTSYWMLPAGAWGSMWELCHGTEPDLSLHWSIWILFFTLALTTQQLPGLKISACLGLFTLVATKHLWDSTAPKGLVTTPGRLSDFYTMSKVLLLTFKGTYSCGCCLLHLQDIPCISPASRAQLESQVCEEEPLETTFHSCGTCSLFLLLVYCSLSS